MSGGRPKVDRKRKKKVDEVDEARANTLRELATTQELIPGLPQDVVLQVVNTMLPWKRLLCLSEISPTWHQAFSSGDIYRLRARKQSTDKHLVISHHVGYQTWGISLYFLRDNSLLQLPPILQVTGGLLQACQCVTLDGKIYIMGGLKRLKYQLSSGEVHMLDLGANTQWKQCASMRSPRCSFGVGVINGKIYVCGGSSNRKPVHETEVYDPAADAWTTVQPMPSNRTGHEVAVWKDELLVFGGKFFLPNFRELLEEINKVKVHATIPEQEYTEAALHVELYNPVQDRWRDSFQHAPHTGVQKLFMLSGRLHSIGESDLNVFDPQQNEWTTLQSVSKAIAGDAMWSRRFWPMVLLNMDDELVVLEDLIRSDGGKGNLTKVLRSRGLGANSAELKWEKILPPSLSFTGLKSRFIRALEL